MKFPVAIRHRSSKVKIYAPAKNFAYYRISYRVAGKRRMQTFPNYPEAKTAAERIVREIAQGSLAAGLTAGQSQDAISALERLDALRQSTGRKISLLGAVSEFAEASLLVRGRPLREVAEAYLLTTAIVKPKNVTAGVEEFLEGRRHKSESKDGQRAQMSPIYASNIRTWLRDFAGTFPGTMICDLTKELFNAYIKKHLEFSAKNRNDRRAAVKMFLTWAVKQDYLSANHRLFEADGMTLEVVETGDIDYYRPDELKLFLENAAPDLRATIAIGGLAGVRVDEIMRLDWAADAWRVEGYIEVKSSKAKTRQRRLVEICPALAAWLEPYRGKTGKVYPSGVNYYQEMFSALRETLKLKIRRNGLRHAFCTYHYALYSNETLTAAQAGNSPAIIHSHYKGLATRSQAESWFAVKPDQ